jgi:hypothetical protein
VAAGWRRAAIGDGGTLPEGAVDLPNNFRNAFLIGQQLAIAVRRRDRQSGR